MTSVQKKILNGGMLGCYSYQICAQLQGQNDREKKAMNLIGEELSTMPELLGGSKNVAYLQLVPVYILQSHL